MSLLNAFYAGQERIRAGPNVIMSTEHSNSYSKVVVSHQQVVDGKTIPAGCSILLPDWSISFEDLQHILETEFQEKYEGGVSRFVEF